MSLQRVIMMKLDVGEINDNLEITYHNINRYTKTENLSFKYTTQEETYVSNTCRLSLPKDPESQHLWSLNKDKQKYCKIKSRRVERERTTREKQLILERFLKKTKEKLNGFKDCIVVINKKETEIDWKTMSKQRVEEIYYLYAIIEKELGIDREYNKEELTMDLFLKLRKKEE